MKALFYSLTLSLLWPVASFSYSAAAIYFQRGGSRAYVSDLCCGPNEGFDWDDGYDGISTVTKGASFIWIDMRYNPDSGGGSTIHHYIDDVHQNDYRCYGSTSKGQFSYVEDGGSVVICNNYDLRLPTGTGEIPEYYFYEYVDTTLLSADIPELLDPVDNYSWDLHFENEDPANTELLIGAWLHSVSSGEIIELFNDYVSTVPIDIDGTAEVSPDTGEDYDYIEVQIYNSIYSNHIGAVQLVFSDVGENDTGGTDYEIYYSRIFELVSGGSTNEVPDDGTGDDSGDDGTGDDSGDDGTGEESGGDGESIGGDSLTYSNVYAGVYDALNDRQLSQEEIESAVQNALNNSLTEKELSAEEIASAIGEELASGELSEDDITDAVETALQNQRLQGDTLGGIIGTQINSALQDNTVSAKSIADAISTNAQRQTSAGTLAIASVEIETNALSYDSGVELSVTNAVGRIDDADSFFSGWMGRYFTLQVPESLGSADFIAIDLPQGSPYTEEILPDEMSFDLTEFTWLPVIRMIEVAAVAIWAVFAAIRIVKAALI